ncbi:hypothetical protein HPB51_005815 [Rhipicephalus microplus]|uniref:Uncharacterized protein n=1 Tax=Rhipicephalus microplus TaxID=6941 RepID=A0A9J6D8P0_RHIMP|nr:hypothetical protein HPB51_005815 [Rhipicephalus microplus]
MLRPGEKKKPSDTCVNSEKCETIRFVSGGRSECRLWLKLCGSALGQFCGAPGSRARSLSCLRTRPDVREAPCPTFFFAGPPQSCSHVDLGKPQACDRTVNRAPSSQETPNVTLPDGILDDQRSGHRTVTRPGQSANPLALPRGEPVNARLLLRCADELWPSTAGPPRQPARSAWPPPPTGPSPARGSSPGRLRTPSPKRYPADVLSGLPPHPPGAQATPIGAQLPPGSAPTRPPIPVTILPPPRPEGSLSAGAPSVAPQAGQHAADMTQVAPPSVGTPSEAPLGAPHAARTAPKVAPSLAGTAIVAPHAGPHVAATAPQVTPTPATAKLTVEPMLPPQIPGHDAAAGALAPPSAKTVPEPVLPAMASKPDAAPGGPSIAPSTPPKVPVQAQAPPPTTNAPDEGENIFTVPPATIVVPPSASVASATFVGAKVCETKASSGVGGDALILNKLTEIKDILTKNAAEGAEGNKADINLRRKNGEVAFFIAAQSLPFLQTPERLNAPQVGGPQQSGNVAGSSFAFVYEPSPPSTQNVPRPETREELPVRLAYAPIYAYQPGNTPKPPVIASSVPLTFAYGPMRSSLGHDVTQPSTEMEGHLGPLVQGAAVSNDHGPSMSREFPLAFAYAPVTAMERSNPANFHSAGNDVPLAFASEQSMPLSQRESNNPPGLNLPQVNAMNEARTNKIPMRFAYAPSSPGHTNPAPLPTVTSRRIPRPRYRFAFGPPFSVRRDATKNFWSTCTETPQVQQPSNAPHTTVTIPTTPNSPSAPPPMKPAEEKKSRTTPAVPSLSREQIYVEEVEEHATTEDSYKGRRRFIRDHRFRQSDEGQDDEDNGNEDSVDEDEEEEGEEEDYDYNEFKERASRNRGWSFERKLPPKPERRQPTVAPVKMGRRLGPHPSAMGMHAAPSYMHPQIQAHVKNFYQPGLPIGTKPDAYEPPTPIMQLPSTMPAYPQEQRGAWMNLQQSPQAASASAGEQLSRNRYCAQGRADRVRMRRWARRVSCVADNCTTISADSGVMNRTPTQEHGDGRVPYPRLQRLIKQERMLRENMAKNPELRKMLPEEIFLTKEDAARMQERQDREAEVVSVQLRDEAAQTMDTAQADINRILQLEAEIRAELAKLLCALMEPFSSRHMVEDGREKLESIGEATFFDRAVFETPKKERIAMRDFAVDVHYDIMESPGPTPPSPEPACQSMMSRPNIFNNCETKCTQAAFIVESSTLSDEAGEQGLYFVGSKKKKDGAVEILLSTQYKRESNRGDQTATTLRQSSSLIRSYNERSDREGREHVSRAKQKWRTRRSLRAHIPERYEPLFKNKASQTVHPKAEKKVSRVPAKHRKEETYTELSFSTEDSNDMHKLTYARKEKSSVSRSKRARYNSSVSRYSSEERDSRRNSLWPPFSSVKITTRPSARIRVFNKGSRRSTHATASSKVSNRLLPSRPTTRSSTRAATTISSSSNASSLLQKRRSQSANLPSQSTYYENASHSLTPLQGVRQQRSSWQHHNEPSRRKQSHSTVLQVHTTQMTSDQLASVCRRHLREFRRAALEPHLLEREEKTGTQNQNWDPPPQTNSPLSYLDTQGQGGKEQDIKLWNNQVFFFVVHRKMIPDKGIFQWHWTRVWESAALLVRLLGLPALASLSIRDHPNHQGKFIVTLEPPHLLINASAAAHNWSVLWHTRAVGSVLSAFGLEESGAASEVTAMERRLAVLVDSPPIETSGLVDSMAVLFRLRHFVAQALHRLVRVTDSTELWVRQPPFVQGLLRLLDESSPQTPLNYLGFRLLVHVAPFYRRCREALVPCWHCTWHNARPLELDMAHACLRLTMQVQPHLALLAVYKGGRELYDRLQRLDFAGRLRAAVETRLQRSTGLLDAVTRAQALRRLRRFQVRAFFPDWVRAPPSEQPLSSHGLAAFVEASSRMTALRLGVRPEARWMGSPLDGHCSLGSRSLYVLASLAEPSLARLSARASTCLMRVLLFDTPPSLFQRCFPSAEVFVDAAALPVAWQLFRETHRSTSRNASAADTFFTHFSADLCQWRGRVVLPLSSSSEFRNAFNCSGNDAMAKLGACQEA